MIVRLADEPLAVEEPRRVAADDVRLHNNFGALRLFFAVLVLFSHGFPLVGGSNDAEPLYRATSHQTTLGSVAVDGFFLISGYLIARSWVRSRTATDFLRKRMLRIYPGYLVALVFSFVVGAISAGPAWIGYVREVGADGDRVLQSALFLQYGGLDQRLSFPTNPFPHFVNGSLWTLNAELRCYAVTAALGTFALLGRRRVLLALLIATYLLFAVETVQHVGETAVWFSRFLLFFLLGTYVASVPTRRPQLSWIGFAAALMLAALLTRVGVLFSLVFPFLFTYLVFGLAFLRRTPGAAIFARHDLSYGIYLYAFPIQQLLAQMAGIRSPLVLFACALPLTAVAALASWRYVESPALAK